jgi:hypothetical protein
MSTNTTMADTTVPVSQDEATAQPTRRFSEGMEHMPLAESVLRIGRFSDGAAPSVIMSPDQVGSFADGLVKRPAASAKLRVGSFADTYIPARKHRPVRGHRLRHRVAPAHAFILALAVSILAAVALAAAAGAATIEPSDTHTTVDENSTTSPKLVKAKGPFGMTPATYPKLVKAKGPFGMTPATYPQLVKAKGPFGMTRATYPKLVNAKGPFGMTPAPSSHDTAIGATAQATGASGREAMSGWRIAAMSEAALLAALALGSALLLSARRRPPRLRA